MTAIDLAALAVGLAVFVAVLALTARPATRRDALARIERTRWDAKPKAEAEEAVGGAVQALRDDAIASNAVIGALLRRLEWSSRRATTLERADLPLKVSEYAALLAGIFFVTVLSVTVISGFALAGLGAGLFSLFVAETVVKHRAAQRAERFQQQLPSALQVMAASLRAGFSIMESIRMVTQEMEAPLAAEFGRILDEQRVGGSFEASLEGLVERMQSKDLGIVVRALQTHRKVGGDLGEILSRVAETMREREKLRGHVKSLTAEQRFGGTVVGLLPLWVLGFFYLFDPSFISPLWEESVGRLILAAGAMLEVTAFFLMRRIVAIEV